MATMCYLRPPLIRRSTPRESKLACLARAANLRVDCVSEKQEAVGLTVGMMTAGGQPEGRAGWMA